MRKARLIDADALKGIYEGWLNDDMVPYSEEFKAVEQCLEQLNDAPTIDPVKHGVLEFLGDHNGQCTVCNEEIWWMYWEEEPKFCEHCGARFDGCKTE